MSQSKNKEAGGNSSSRIPMDIKQIKSLIELMVDNDLSRIELREGDTHILLRRGQPVVAHPPVAAHVPPGPTAANPAPAPAAHAAAPAKDAAQPAATENEVLIRSPMVGTVYVASDPESPPFVDVDTVVSPNTLVCMIEAMKVFNEIKAELAGRITKVLVKNAQAVEFDQPLFVVAPA